MSAPACPLCGHRLDAEAQVQPCGARFPEMDGKQICENCAAAAFRRLMDYVAATAHPADGTSPDQFAVGVASGRVPAPEPERKETL